MVERDIPLLISKGEMKERGFKLNLEDDILKVKGQQFQLETTATGHYMLPLNSSHEVNIANIVSLDLEAKKKTVLKLHKQFCHPGKESLKALLKNAG